MGDAHPWRYGAVSVTATARRFYNREKLAPDSVTLYRRFFQHHQTSEKPFSRWLTVTLRSARRDDLSQTLALARAFRCLEMP